VAEYLEGQLPVLEELVGDQRRHLREEGDEGEVGEQDHGLLVVAASDGRVLHLPEVGEPEQEVVVQLERRQAAPVVVRMQRGNRLWTKLMASSPSAEKKEKVLKAIFQIRILIRTEKTDKQRILISRDTSFSDP
jgi:hypothetical protein